MAINQTEAESETGRTETSSRSNGWSASALWPEVIASALYFALAIFSATHRRLWFDEINTVLLSRLPPSELWSALASGADTNPPLLYWPVHLLNAFISNTELACRLPSIFEFFLMMAGIYWIARKYISPLYALIASFVPFLTIAGSYATEGRGYAATFGFSTLALLCWRNAASRKPRLLWLCGISIGVAAALGNHYSAALILTALFGGEAIRVIGRGKIDWPVAAAIALGGTPLIAFRPLMGAIHRYLLSYWAKPSFYEIFSAYSGWRLAALLIVSLFAIGLVRRDQDGGAHRFGPVPPIPFYEIAAWLILLLSPVQGYLQGLITGGFTMRYALPMVIPIAIFTGIYAFRVLRGSVLPGLLLLAILVSICAEKLLIVTVRPAVSESEARWIEKNCVPNSGRCVVGSPVVFSPLYFYANKSLKSRLAYLSSPELSSRYLKMNSPDLNLSEMSKFSPLPVVDYEVFMRNRSPFTLVNDGDSWLLRKLLDDKVPVRRMSCEDTWCAYRVVPIPD